jgi:hypothetical protein
VPAAADQWMKLYWLAAGLASAGILWYVDVLVWMIPAVIGWSIPLPQSRRLVSDE